MQRSRKPSPETVRVLKAMVREPDRARYGYELGEEVGLRSGSLYPILMRLSDRGLVEAAWELSQPGRPPRHLYRLTGDGVRLAHSLATEGPAEHGELRPATESV